MFSELKTHPLPTENEKAQIANLINRNSIGDVKDFLLSPAGRSVTADIEQQHQRAVSFLLEAWKMEPELVRAVAREVILDGQLENVKIPMAQRELMAKDKAEIMYHFLAMDAQLANEITPAKLTPSAQAILSKVRHEHRLNLAQSGLEVSKFQAGQW